MTAENGHVNKLPKNHCNQAVLRVNKMVAGEFVDIAGT